MNQIKRFCFPIPEICVIGGCLLLSFLNGCASANPSLYPPLKADEQSIFLLDNHWHTAMIVPCKRLPASFRQQLGNLAAGPYVAIGWGDEGFFRASKITAPLALQALFYSRGSVLQVFRLDDPPTAFARDISVYRLAVSSKGLDRMITQVCDTFVTRDGQIVDVGGSVNGGRFFAAHDRYSLLHTCNQWTADVLHSGGLPISSAYAGLASNFEWQLQQPAVVGVVEFRSADQAER